MVPPPVALSSPVWHSAGLSGLAGSQCVTVPSTSWPSNVRRTRRPASSCPLVRQLPCPSSVAMAASEDGAERGVFPHARARPRAKHAGSLARDTVESRDLPGDGRHTACYQAGDLPRTVKIRARQKTEESFSSFFLFLPFHKILKGVSQRSGPKLEC